MGGRARGRGGSNLSLTHDQLQSLGTNRGDNVQVLTPPPLFPKLETKPLPLVSDPAIDYMLIVKDQFIEYLHESPAYVKANTETDGIERYSDKYKLALDEKKDKVLNCVWTNMPSELRPQARRVKLVTRKRKLDDPTIAKRLQKLEKKETMAGSTQDVVVIEDEENKDENDEDLEEEQEQDEEVDDGTDYANNYFDNGEDYDEEDDNLDDGAVY